MESHYEVLGLSPDADDRAVRQAYRSLLTDHHPDQGGSRETFLRIKTAYESILDERAPAGRKADGGRRTLGSQATTARGGDASTRRTHPPTYDPADRPADGGHDHEVTVSGEYLTLTLAGLVHDIDLESLVTGPVTAATSRTVAFFRIHNTSTQPLTWEGKANTSFVGDDGFLYEGSSIVTPHAAELPGRWTCTDVDIEPGRALDGIVIAQAIPDDVTLEQVMYTQHVPDDSDGVADTERYLFELRPLVRDRLDRFPFERD